jgi:glycosyltransferase involved in cell wall biosynthesis
MRVGIDAKSFYTGPISTRIILQNLLPQLFKHYPQFEWIIFLDKKDKRRGFPFLQKNVIPCYVWADNNLLSNVFILPGRAKKLRADVVVYQTFPPFNSHVPSIAFIHDVLFRSYPQFFTKKEQLYFKPLTRLAPRAKRLIATTNFVADTLAGYGYTKSHSRVDLVPLGVNQGFKPKELHDPHLLNQVKFKFNLPERYLLFVGRLNTRKNIESLLEALPVITDKSISLVIVGEKNWKAPNLEKVVTETNLGNRIILAGGVTDTELQCIYALATLFCYPSFAEGFGLPPLEAMASGIPVVVSNTTAMPEVCGTAAQYIDPHDPIAIAAAIDLLLNNTNTYDEFKKLGLEHAASYTWEATAHAFMKSILKIKEPLYEHK